MSQKLQLQNYWDLSASNFTLIPESVQKSSAVFSPLFTANLALDIFFDGQEKDNYNTNLIGLSLNQFINKKVKLKWMASHYADNENENYDITGTYLFGERDFDKTQPTYGQIVTRRSRRLSELRTQCT